MMTSVKENQSVRNACLILEAIAKAQPVGVSELARRTGIEKSAAHRLAVTLHRAGWLSRTSEGRWRIAPGLATRFARAGATSLVDAVHPALEDLRDETGETAMLVAVEGERLVVLAVAESPHALRVTAPVGSELPIRNSSALRAIAAHSTVAELEQLRRIDPGLDDSTLTEARRRGWAINDREITPDACVAGAAILARDGVPLGAVITCAPSSRVDALTLQTIGARVAEAVAQLAVDLDVTTTRSES